jgi:BirA family transcriptional regulator, biotin operon repressor / biotin---[acetyl-CoA-carboxylase] ligase
MPTPAPQLASHAEPLDAAALAVAGYATVVHLPETDSTMVESRRLAADPAARLPALVIADRQTSGRGRRGAGWWQAEGSLAASIVVDGSAVGLTTASPQPFWSLACGVVLAEVIRALEPGIDVRIKWPNDLEVAGRKLAGIIVEAAASGRTIFGIGVNTAGSATAAPAGLCDRVVTLPDLVGRPLCRTRLLAAWLPRLCTLLREMDADPDRLADRYLPLCGLAGRAVTIHVGTEQHSGICRGIAADGSLVIDTPAGPRPFASGSLTPPGGEWQRGHVTP